MQNILFGSWVVVVALAGVVDSRPKDASEEEALCELSGDGFVIADLSEGGRAFSNRKYVWERVPMALEGYQYAQTAGGVGATMTLKAKSSGIVRAAVMVDRMLDFKDLGWTLEKPERDNTFSYSDADNKLMIVMTRHVEKGETITVPQVGWAGSLVLLPPHDPQQQ